MSAITFQKPKHLKYTDMAIYIDAHVPDIIESGKNPEIELTVYEYIYLICYALSFKAGYFGRNVPRYDDFSLYMAAEIYEILVKRYRDSTEGREFHGKAVKPVKSVLNYIKSTLYPMKVNYQQTYYQEILNNVVSGDTSALKAQMVQDVQKDYSGELKESYQEAVEQLPAIVESVFKHTPFRSESVLKTQLRNSIYLTLIDQVTLPNHMVEKIEKKRSKSKDWEMSVHFMKAHEALGRPVRLWHLNDSYANYVSVLTTEVKKELSKRTQYYIHNSDLSEELIDSILNTAYATYGDDNTGD